MAAIQWKPILASRRKSHRAMDKDARPYLPSHCLEFGNCDFNL